MQFQSDSETLPSHKAAAREIIATTTKQDALFPVSHMSFGSNAERHLQLEGQLFSIKDDFLYACITYGDGLENKPFSGFTWVKGLGYAFLAFFAQRAFGIHRFPFFPDRNMCGYLTDKQVQTVIDTINMLSAERVNAICYELLDIYQHAQNLLKERGIGEVHLTRKILDGGDCPTSRENYTQTIMTLKKAAQAVGVDKVQFEMDVLNSWGDDSGYSSYPILLRQSLPAQDVLYFSNMIASRAAPAGIIASPWKMQSGCFSTALPAASLTFTWMILFSMRACTRTRGNGAGRLMPNFSKTTRHFPSDTPTELMNVTFPLASAGASRRRGVWDTF